MFFQIKCRFSARVLFEGEFDSLKLTLEAAVKARANLVGAYLGGANLRGANLFGAYLGGAKIGDGIAVTRAPLQISGLKWLVTIWDEHMQIGCEFHSLADWAAFDDRRIAAMDGRDALKFWRAHKAALLALAESDGRGVAKKEAA